MMGPMFFTLVVDMTEDPTLSVRLLSTSSFILLINLIDFVECMLLTRSRVSCYISFCCPKMCQSYFWNK